MIISPIYQDEDDDANGDGDDDDDDEDYEDTIRLYTHIPDWATWAREKRLKAKKHCVRRRCCFGC